MRTSLSRWLSALLLAAFALGAGPLRAAPLTAAETAEVEKAENYLNAIHTLKARFIQVAPSGDTSEGTVYMSRPGRLRLDYDAPSPVQVIADGSFLIYFDRQLKQVSYLGLDDSPAGVLVRAQVKLDSGDLKVTKVGHAPNIIAVTVTRRADPSQGSISLIFSDNPYALRQWRVVDPQGQATMVSLYTPQIGVPLDKDLFEFKDPKFGNGQPDLSTQGK